MTNNNEVSSTTKTTPLNHFSQGTEVEVTSDEEGFKGAWFRATIITNKDPSSSSSSSISNNSNPNPNPGSTTITTTFKRRRKVLVEYRNLVTEDGSQQLRESVDLAHLRPLPPEIGSPASFEVGDVVDADYRDGWWTGVVKKALGDSKFRVFFDNPPDLIEFHHNQMRFHQDWINNHWIRPKREPQITGSHFSPGTDVEVNIDDEDLTDVWIPSIVVKENKDNTFLVKFQNPGPKQWGHTVDFLHIRPPAPHYADRAYKLREKVDAFHDFAWRAGEISKILYGKTYVVTLKNGIKSKDLSRTEIRPRLEWKGGKWEIESKEALATSNSNMTDELEPAKKRSKNSETAVQPESQGSDKLEKKAPQRSASGKSLTEQSTDQKGELVSSVPPIPSAPPNRVGRGRRSKVFKDGIKENDIRELVTPATERLPTRTRKPVIPFKFENFPKTRRHSDATTEVLQTAPVKRMGRPKKSEAKNLVTPVVGKVPTANNGAAKKLVDSKGVKNETEVPIKLVDKKGAKNETELPSKLVDKKGVKNETDLPSKLASSSHGAKDLPAKVSSQSLNKELQTLTIDVWQSADEQESEERERKQRENGASSNKRKRGRPPRKLSLLYIRDSDGDNLQNGGVPIQEIAYPVIDITLPVQGAVDETLDLQDGSRRKRRDVSPTKAVKNDSGKGSGSQGNSSLDDDDRPLSTWFGAMPSQTEALGKTTVNQQNGNEEQQTNAPKETPAINASNDVNPGENQRLPFTKKSPIWKVVESLEIFRVMPQSPHFRPLYKCKEECREGLAIGHMVTFSSLVDKISKLRFEDRGSNFSSTLESLLELENQGFEISALRDRVSKLSSIRDKLEPAHKEAKAIETKIKEHADKKTKRVAEIEDIKKKISELKEKQESIRVEIEIKDVDVDRLQQNLDVAYGSISNLRQSFEKLRCAPFKET